MTQRASIPKEIRRIGVQSLRITWEDGHVSEYDNGDLRNRCPCAACRERPQRRLPLASGQGEPLYAVEIGLVGRYAVSIEWSDGHDDGIYSYETLRGLCPCERCRDAAEPRASETG
jgi:DUF971 family protein